MHPGQDRPRFLAQAHRQAAEVTIAELPPILGVHFEPMQGKQIPSDGAIGSPGKRHLMPHAIETELFHQRSENGIAAGPGRLDQGAIDIEEKYVHEWNRFRSGKAKGLGGNCLTVTTNCIEYDANDLARFSHTSSRNDIIPMLAVIFDVDGVLVDSYQAHFITLREEAALHGLSCSEQEFAANFGRTTRETFATLWSQAGFTAEQITQFDLAKEQRYRDYLRNHFPVMPGARELIDDLAAAGFRLAVGSSGPPENVALTLAQLGRESSFAAKVTGSDVARGKPDPQVFLLAAQRLGVDPRYCAVIEDAPPGIAAANAAGAVSIGFTSTGRTAEQLAAANHIVGSLKDLSAKRLADWIQHR